MVAKKITPKKLQATFNADELIIQAVNAIAKNDNDRSFSSEVEILLKGAVLKHPLAKKSPEFKALLERIKKAPGEGSL